MFIRRKTLDKIIRNKVDAELSVRIKKLDENTAIQTIVDSGRHVYFSSESLKSIVHGCVKDIIDEKVNEIGKRINDDLNQESLIDSIIERINRKQIK